MSQERQDQNLPASAERGYGAQVSTRKPGTEPGTVWCRLQESPFGILPAGWLIYGPCTREPDPCEAHEKGRYQPCIAPHVAAYSRERDAFQQGSASRRLRTVGSCQYARHSHDLRTRFTC